MSLSVASKNSLKIAVQDHLKQDHLQLKRKCHSPNEIEKLTDMVGEEKGLENIASDPR